jgi:hypothetical protein
VDRGARPVHELRRNGPAAACPLALVFKFHNQVFRA